MLIYYVGQLLGSVHHYTIQCLLEFSKQVQEKGICEQVQQKM